MRYTLALLLSMFLLVAYALIVPGQAVSPVDQYISQSRGEVTVSVDPRFPADPWESRRLYEEKRSGAQAVEGAEEVSGIEPKTAVTFTEPLPPEPVAEPLPDVAGNWSLILDNATAVDLTVVQAGEAAFGQGTLTDDSATQLIAALAMPLPCGLRMDLLSFGPLSLYRLDLDLEGSSASGSYSAYGTSGELSASGVVVGDFERTLA